MLSLTFVEPGEKNVLQALVLVVPKSRPMIWSVVDPIGDAACQV